MLKEYTVNALIVGNTSLKQALMKLRELRVSPRNIDQLSHLDSKDKPVHIAKSNKSHLCAFYGFLFGGALGLLVLLLSEIEMRFALLELHPQLIFESIWVHMASGGAVGVLAGYIIGRKLVQYVIRHEAPGETHFRHLLMIEANDAKKDEIVEALKPFSESVDVLDNNTEVELGLQARA